MLCAAEEAIAPRLTFAYDGQPVDSDRQEKSVAQRDGWRIESFALPKGLVVSTESVRHGEAVEWVTWFENRGQEETGLLSAINDCDVSLPFEKDEIPPSAALKAEGPGLLVHAHNGSSNDAADFSADVTSWTGGSFRKAALPNLPDGKPSTQHYGSVRGRSSDPTLPFFNLNRGEKGVIVAVGWTGRWRADFTRAADGRVRIASGLAEAEFRLRPGERVRTSSVVLMPYSHGYVRSQNDFRRLMRAHYSPIGRAARPKRAPYSLMLWGGMTSRSLVSRIDCVAREKLGFDFAWVDAGWYGTFTTPSPNEYEGEWWSVVGDWRPNPKFHPDGLADVAAACRRADLGFLLWFEIERAGKDAPIRREHPEFFVMENLLDLGNEKAWTWAHETLRTRIRELGLSCYRQDLNISPGLTDHWRAADEKGRIGLSEIRHVMGLYRLWDALLDEFPGLLIDNCAGGGRRIDIEMCKRSVPLWRSDYQCPANPDPDVAQNHHLGIARFLPYHGTSVGRRLHDVYRFRSTYSPGMSVSAFFTEADDPDGLSSGDFAWIRRMGEEYRRVRELMEGDFHPLAEMERTVNKGAWCAYQYAKGGEGCLLVFRREASPCRVADYRLGGLEDGVDYVFTDADTGETSIRSGADIRSHGLTVEIPNPRQSKLLFYRRK